MTALTAGDAFIESCGTERPCDGLIIISIQVYLLLTSCVLSCLSLDTATVLMSYVERLLPLELSMTRHINFWRGLLRNCCLLLFVAVVVVVVFEIMSACQWHIASYMIIHVFLSPPLPLMDIVYGSPAVQLHVLYHCVEQWLFVFWMGNGSVW